MSTAPRGRRLVPLERPSRQESADALTANVRAMNRAREQERDAALAMVALAQALAGTVPQAGVQPPPAPAESDPGPAASPRLAGRPAPPRRRPDQHVEVTHEEAMATPWVDATTPGPEPGPPPRPPPGFEAWNLIIPSYARGLDDGEESR